jgi:carbon storage regulator
MLVLSRRVGEEIVIDGGIRVRVVSVKGNQVRIGVSAPPDVSVDRQEVAERRLRERSFCAAEREESFDELVVEMAGGL